jgi:AraC-like DNA-binding protein
MRVKKELIKLPDLSLRFLRFELDAFRTELHRHAQLELTWIEKGTGVRFVGDCAEAFESGDLVLLGSELPHAWVSASADALRPSVASVLQFHGALFAQAAMPELAALQPLALQARRGLKISGQTHEFVTRRLRDLRDADGLGRFVGLIDILRGLSLRPKDLTPVSVTTSGTAKAGEPLRRIDRVIQWVQANVGGTLSTREAAHVAHISPAAFSRFFRRETGKTFTHYVNEVRCAEACVLLRKSDAAVAEIAADCGFRTSSHFNREFLARLRTTPRAYRQRA